MNVVWFLAGVFVGCLVGVLVVALCVAAGDVDRVRRGAS